MTVGDELTGKIESELMLLVGITHEDTEKDAQYLADKVSGLRIYRLSVQPKYADQMLQ